MSCVDAFLSVVDNWGVWTFSGTDVVSQSSHAGERVNIGALCGIPKPGKINDE